ncbi:hypothetical protein RHGRI_020442 [Rhododendron griersonianum]|uniref:Leucine-rich repeat-containing N-terminal plant-type domain-containing protein n=1 Tax=Rhododendron griersonianum TaxID=479676 RepID=A0AAV6JGF6_9ERIC|nr:hypothetical protein RHGRI_020442 [Rhododendron griersonianum]
MSSTAALPMSNETDRQALLDIKDLAQGDAFPVFRSWNHSIHFCKWEGVTCGRKHQRVTILDLSSRGLVGSLSPHAGNLTFLRTIDLGNNSFHGTIPNEIGRLFRLQHVILWNNSFEGKLPTNITGWSNIKEINLNNNHLGGELPVGLEERIPDSLGNCKRLLEIDLGSNNLTGTIPGPIFELSSLSIGLFLGRNQLTGPIPTQIGNLRNLGKLNLSENRLSGGIPATLSSFQVLELLSLAGNHFEGPIPTSLNQLKGEVPIDGLFKNVSAFSVVGNSKLCGGVEELQLPACPANVLQKKKGPLNNKVIILLKEKTIKQTFLWALALFVYLEMLEKEYGLGEEISTRGDMYSYGVLLLEMFIGKRPTDCMFTEPLSLSSYTKMFLPDKVLEIIDPCIKLEEEKHPSRTRQTITPNTNELEVCLASVLQIGVSCCAALPSERMNARDVLGELHRIRNLFIGPREQGKQQGRMNDS